MDTKKTVQKYKTWKEFDENLHQYAGKLPAIFEAIDNEMTLTTSDIATIIEVHEETVRRWCRQGQLRIISPSGRYKILGSDLKEFLYQKWRKKFID